MKLKPTNEKTSRLNYVVQATWADQINARFDNPESFFVSISERLEEILERMESAEDELAGAIKVFKKNNPNFKWEDVELVQSLECVLGDVLIDDTMNRPVVFEHVLNILRNFDETKVMALNVYVDPARPGKYVAWDGQHTSILLYIIAVTVCGKSVNKVKVPINIYKTTNKAKIRENFIVLAGEGKEPISALALFTNKVFGVRLDGSKNPNWIAANEKQNLLASAGLFLTEKSRGDMTKPGAITQVETIDNASLETVECFCMYWRARKAKQYRRAESKELLLMLQFIQMCRDQKIKITDKYFEDAVEIMWDCFDCDFTCTKNMKRYFDKVEVAYRNWFKSKFHPKCEYEELSEDEQTLHPRYDMTKKSGTEKQDPYVIAFLIEQLRHSGFKHKLPKSSAESTLGFMPAAEDLW